MEIFVARSTIDHRQSPLVYELFSPIGLEAQNAWSCGMTHLQRYRPAEIGFFGRGCPNHPPRLCLNCFVCALVLNTSSQRWHHLSKHGGMAVDTVSFIGFTPEEDEPTKMPTLYTVALFWSRFFAKVPLVVVSPFRRIFLSPHNLWFGVERKIRIGSVSMI